MRLREEASATAAWAAVEAAARTRRAAAVWRGLVEETTETKLGTPSKERPPRQTIERAFSHLIPDGRGAQGPQKLVAYVNPA